MQHGLNTMSKQQLREKMAADAAQFTQQHDIVKYAAQSSPQEHRYICGAKKRRGSVKKRDPQHERYNVWLADTIHA
jgi:hypothetical protein